MYDLSAVCGGLTHCSWGAWQVLPAVKESTAHSCDEEVNFLPWGNFVPQNVCGADQRKLQKCRSPCKGKEGAASFASAALGMFQCLGLCVHW